MASGQTPDIRKVDDPTTKPITILHPEESSYGYLVTGLAIENTKVPDDMNDRVRQQDVIPSAIKGRLMQPVQDDGGVILTASALIPDGFSAVANVSTISSNKGMIIGVVYFQVFIDNLIFSQRMPQMISSSKFPFYVWPNLYDNTGNSMTPPRYDLDQPVNNQPSKTNWSIQIRNNDGVSHLIYIQAYPRIIINGSSGSS